MNGLGRRTRKLLLTLPVLAGCSEQPTGPAAPPSREKAALADAGCGRDPARLSPGHVTLDVAGVARRVYVVPPVQTERPVSVVVAFHGRGKSGELVANQWQLSADREEAVLALYPEGLPQPWFHGYVGWDTRGETSPELAFFDAMLAFAEQNFCIDPGRIHVLGHSWGGGMANLVGCMRGDVRSLVSVGGGGPTVPCRGPVSAMIIHGTADQDEPLSSGQDNVDAWSFYNGCGSEREPTLDGACEEFTDCAAGAPVLWCEHPGGHGWPASLQGDTLWQWLERT